MKKIYIFALSALLLTACSGEEPAGNPEGEVAVRITAGVNDALTRADGSVWEADRIGVTVTSSPKSDMATRYRNMLYSTTSNDAVAEFSAAGEEIYFQNREESVTFSAYAPYSELTGSDSSADAAVAFNTEDQSSRELQKKIDFIYAEGATASREKPEVLFSDEAAFRHVMSRLVIEVRTSTDDGFSAEEVFGGHYTLGGLAHSAVFKPFKGVVEASGEAVADWNLDTKARSVNGTASKTFSAILVPQTLAEPLKFKAELAGQIFLNETGIKPTLESGKSYKYTITVRKTGLTVSGCTIVDWTDGGSFDGDATMPVPPIGDRTVEEAQPMDLYLCDGSILSFESWLEYEMTKKQLDSAIGFVIYSGRHPEDKSDYTDQLNKGHILRDGKVHGYVLSLAMVRDSFTFKWTNGTAEEISGILSATDENDWSGYRNNIIMKRSQVSFPAAEACWSFGRSEPSYEWQKGFAAPSSTTGWFLPSSGQLCLVNMDSQPFDTVFWHLDMYMSEDAIAKEHIKNFLGKTYCSSSISTDLLIYGQNSWGCDLFEPNAGFSVRPILVF